ncbi:MAG: TrmH family RNA methyltransferase [Eubacterium sp.]
MEKITGKNNNLIKDIKKLLSSSRQRKAQGLFVTEGARLVFDVLNSLYEIKYFLITQPQLQKYKTQADLMIEKSEKSFIISEEISQRLSDTQNPQGVFAVCKMKENNNDLLCGKKYIALDNVQDPGNLGAISRTAEALGIDGMIICGGCDIYNPKALRASMGSMLRIPVSESDNLKETLLNSKKCGFAVYATVADSSAKKITEIDFNKSSICVIGNEANGISDDIKEVCDGLITIPMLGRAESLNASVAASITMWEMLR